MWYDQRPIIVCNDHYPTYVLVVSNVIRNVGQPPSDQCYHCQWGQINALVESGAPARDVVSHFDVGNTPLLVSLWREKYGKGFPYLPSKIGNPTINAILGRKITK